MVQTRGPTGSLRRVTIGRDTKMTAEAARRTAAEVIDRISSGEDPFPAPPTPEPTVADLAERYMKAHVEVNCRPGTVGIFRRVVDLYILPELGALKISAVERSHVSDLHFKMRDKPYQANQTISVLAKMFNLADKWGWRPSTRNPCKGVPRYKVEQHHERYLTREEFFRLGEAIRAAPAEGLASAHAAAAIRVLVLTGCRRNEILGLRWDDLNFDSGEMRLRDSKTGPRMAPMPSAAAEVFRGLSRTPNNPWVFPGRKWGAHLSNLNDSWDRIRKRAGLDGVRLHDLRHSFASRALALGETLPVIGKLLGHSDIETTARYAHLARDSILDAAERIAGSIATDIL